MNLRKGDVILTKGTSWISKTIEFVTRSPYSHAACYIGDGFIIESATGGVQFARLQDKYGTTSYDVYRHRQASPNKIHESTEWMCAQIGKGYDYQGLIGILISLVGKKKRNYLDSQKRYWCAELVLDGFHHAGVYTGFDINTYTVSPADISRSLCFEKISRD